MTIDDIMPLLQSEDIEDNILGVLLGAKADVWKAIKYPLSPAILGVTLATLNDTYKPYPRYKGDVIFEGKQYRLRTNRLMLLCKVPADLLEHNKYVNMLYDDGSLKQYTDGKG